MTEIETVFRFVDRDIEIASRRPIVQLDAKGDFAAVRYSTRLDYAPPLPPTELAIYYRARRRFRNARRIAALSIRFSAARR